MPTFDGFNSQLAGCEGKCKEADVAGICVLIFLSAVLSFSVYGVMELLRLSW